MSSLQQLPAVLLPNSENALDTTAIFRDGTKSTVSDLLRIIEAGADLRFMVMASDPKSSECPRITWHVQSDGSVIVSAAFVSETDKHGRVASAALVYELSESTDFLSKIPTVLPSDQLRHLREVLEAINEALHVHVGGQRNLGKVGGEYGLEKKNLVSPNLVSTVLVISLAFIIIELARHFF